jgi:hypothetical protein
MATANPELRSYQEAQAQLDEIQRLSNLLDADPDNDDLQEELRGLALCQDVRTDWQSIGQDLEPTQYRLLLCTGGPAVQVVGDLDEAGDPCTARLQRQDWLTPWEDVTLTEPEEEMLIWFAQSFYWGN